MGRKDLYEQQVKPHLCEIESMARDGLTQQQIANALRIAPRTFARYLEKQEELQKAVSAGREIAVKTIENAMYQAALGQTVKVKKVMKIKKAVYENGRKVDEVEALEPYEEEQYIKADTTAAIFLLKNWAKGSYSTEPMAHDLKLREIELKERKAGEGDDGDYDPFA